MKKKKYILIGLVISILSILTIGIVYALGYKIDLKWGVEPTVQIDPRVVNSSINLRYKDGFIFGDKKIKEVTEHIRAESLWGLGYDLSYVDLNGKKITEASTGSIDKIINDNKYIYLFKSIIDLDNSDNNKYYVEILNNKMELIKEIVFDEETYDDIDGYKANHYYSCGFDIATTINNKTCFYTSSDFVCLDVENGTFDSIPNTDESLNKYFPLIYLAEKDEDNNFDYYDKEDDIVAKSGSLYTFNSDDEYLAHAIGKVEQNGEKLFEYENEKYRSFSDVKIISNYIVLTASSGSRQDSERGVDKSDVLVFDLEGNLLNTLSNNSKYVNLIEDEEGFIVSKYYAEGICDFADVEATTREAWVYDSCKTYLTHEKYTLSEVKGATNEDNPETASLPIILFVVFSFGCLLFIKKSKTKMGQIN